MAQAVADELGDGEDPQIVFGAELESGRERGPWSPSSLMISQMTPAGMQAGEARKIDGGFGLSSADQNASLARAQREDVAGTREIVAAAYAGSMATWMV